jgi:hypothetical protein
MFKYKNYVTMNRNSIITPFYGIDKFIAKESTFEKKIMTVLEGLNFISAFPEF